MTTLIKPISLGSVEIADPVVLAPMSGVTDLPFRRLVKSFGAGLVISEMIASQAMIRQVRKSLKMSSGCHEDFPMAVQIAGCEPSVMAEAARLNVDRGAAIIDINMGCPVKKVTRGFAGSALMRDLDHAARLIKATVKAVSVPVTLKMRTGWDDNSRNAPQLARIAEDCGVKMLSVHGRTRCQLYRGRADWDFIAEVKDAVSIPVLANGDVTTVVEAATILSRSGADGVMIGRGCYGRPWFLRQVIEYLKNGTKLPDPDIKTQMDVVLFQVRAMIDHYGELTALRMARKHIAWYSRGLPGSGAFRNRINKLDKAAAVIAEITAFYTPLTARRAA